MCTKRYWEIEKKKSRLQALAKTKNALGETSRKITSHPKDHQPRLSQLPLLPQEHREAVHGGERLWVLRTEVHFAPRKTSALQCLGLASRDGARGLDHRPGSACEYHVEREEK